MIGTGIWRETLRNEKNDKCTLQDMTYGENTDKRKRENHRQEKEYVKKHRKTWKMRNIVGPEIF